MNRSSRGFTLVELMVAMAIGLVMTVVIVTVFSRSSKTSTVTQSVNEVQEQARVALDMLQRDLRQSGYVGCNSNRLLSSGGLVNTTATPTAYLNNIQIFLQGYNGTGAFAPAAPAEVTGAAPAALATADAITVRVPRGEPVVVSGVMANGLASVPVFSTAAFAVGDVAVVSDCAQSSVFVVTGTAGSLAHASGGVNATADLGRAYQQDALVVPFDTISYYLAPSGLNGERSLWRRVNNTVNSEEVAEGVEDFQITYGLDTNGDIFADVFLTANAVPNWAQVVAVRINLLLRSKSDRSAQTVQNYNFNGALGVVPADTRLHRPFSTTVQLRNRTL